MALLRFTIILFVLTFFQLRINGAKLADQRSAPATKPSRLLVISFDGFRPEYLERNITPTLEQVRTSGVRTPYMRNVFPTKTLTNHFTIATGLLPGVHGVVGNEIYDLKLKKTLGYSYELYHYNNDILPVWTINQIAGHHSGCMMWPGSNYPYQEINCTYTMTYNHDFPWKQKVDKVMEWFKDEDRPANFVMAYFDEPDFFAHVFSPNSEQVRDMVIQSDQITNYIQTKLRQEHLDDQINVIYLSDHGMDSLVSPNFIDLTKMLDNGTYEMYGTSPVLQIVPKDGELSSVLTKLQNGARTNGHFKIYTNENVLPRWKFNNDQRIGPITAVADINYAFQDMFQLLEYYKKEYHFNLTPTHEYGQHGYDNDIASMHAIFMATGPTFRQNYQIDPFDNLDLFNLFAMILGIPATLIPANNGTFEHIRLMVLDESKVVRSSNAFNVVIGIGISFMLIGTIAGMFFIWRRRQKLSVMPEDEHVFMATDLRTETARDSVDGKLSQQPDK